MRLHQPQQFAERNTVDHRASSSRRPACSRTAAIIAEIASSPRYLISSAGGRSARMPPCESTTMRSASSRASGQVVRDHHRGEAHPLVQRAIGLAELAAGHRVERAEGLVHQHD